MHGEGVIESIGTSEGLVVEALDETTRAWHQVVDTYLTRI